MNNDASTSSVTEGKKLSEECRQVLLDLYNSGALTSAKDKAAIAEAIQKTGLDRKRIMDIGLGSSCAAVEIWSVADRHPPDIGLGSSCAAVNIWRARCRHADTGQSTGGIPVDWGEKWAVLTEAEKDSYKQKSQKMKEEGRQFGPQHATKLIKAIQVQVNNAQKAGVDLALIGFDRNKMMTEMVGNEEIIQKLITTGAEAGVAAMYGGGENPGCQVQKERKNVLSSVQRHLNTLYETATGKMVSFPYKKLRTGELKVEGLPFPLKTGLSALSRQKLMLLLDVTSITVTPATTLPLLPTAATSTATATTTTFSVVVPSASTSEQPPARTSEQPPSDHSNLVVETIDNEAYIDAMITEAIALEEEVPTGEVPTLATTTETKKKRRKRKCEEEFYSIETILGHKTEGRKKFIHVKWVGYDETQWIPATNLKK